MNVLITGAKGFIGKNLVAQLHNLRDGKVKHPLLSADLTVWEYDVDTPPERLDEYCARCDFVFHLAGVNRPPDPADFLAGNYGFTASLLDTLRRRHNPCPVMLASSTQAALDNPYGQSKHAGEELLRAYGRETGASVLVYRFPNVFGKWCRPNYNSAVATFCHQIARGLPITVNDREARLTLVYIDDVVEELLRALAGAATACGDFCRVPEEYPVVLGDVVDALYSFRASREERSVPDMADPFVKKLYATYLSYLPEDGFAYPLDTHTDARGSFTEILRTADRGQFSVNISKPGITKGNHWHHTKNEKFVVVSGRGVIRFRRPDSEQVIEYFVSGERIEVVDIPTGYTHNIENLGDTDLVTFMWCNECFDPDRPDTYSLEV